MFKTNVELFEVCDTRSEAVQKSKGYEEAELISSLFNNFSTNSPWIKKPRANLDSRVVGLFASFL